MRYLLYTILFINLVACEREGKLCLRKAGEIENKEVVLSPFTHLRASDNIHYTLIPSTESKMVITTGSNILSTISYQYEGDTLVVENNSGCRWFRRYEKNQVNINLYTPNLKGIRLEHGGSVVSNDTLRGQFLELQAWNSGGTFDLLVNVDTLSIGLHSGPVNAIVKGQANVSYTYAAGVGTIDCSLLQADICYVNNSSFDDFHIWSTQYAGIQILREGNVFLRGNPATVEGTFTGSGELILE